MDVGWFPHISYVRTWNHPFDTTINMWLFRVPGKHSWLKFHWNNHLTIQLENLKPPNHMRFTTMIRNAVGMRKSWNLKLGVSTSRDFQTTAMEYFVAPWFPVNNKPDTKKSSKRKPHNIIYRPNSRIIWIEFHPTTEENMKTWIILPFGMLNGWSLKSCGN